LNARQPALGRRAAVEPAQEKRAAAECAADLVCSGMVVGLGTGSTAIFALRAIADRLAEGRLTDIVGIPTSTVVEAAARDLGIPVGNLGTHPVIDLTIDGADEVDPNLNLIKGGGGALLREKIVAQASAREIIVVDASKLSKHLGTRHRGRRLADRAQKQVVLASTLVATIEPHARPGLTGPSGRCSGLISKGMIYSPAHGDTAFTVPLFDEFLLRVLP
jgi:hypothetical protein